MNKIAIKKPTQSCYRLKQLFERWDVSLNDLLWHFKNGDLKIKLNWNFLRERAHNKECIHTEEYWEPLIVPDICGMLDFRTPCWNCKEYENKKRCKFEFPPGFRKNNLTESQQQDLYRVNITSIDLLFMQDEVEKFEKKFQQEQKPDYLDHDHPHYIRELKAMIEAWHSIFIEKKLIRKNETDKKFTCKQAAINFITDNYKDAEFPPSKIENMAAIVASKFTNSKDWNKFIQDCQNE